MTSAQVRFTRRGRPSNEGCESAVVERLRRLWDEGKASGPAESLEWEHTLAVAKARLKEIVAENDARPSIAAIAPP